ncbi:hypothetical protein [Persephonella sp.]
MAVLLVLFSIFGFSFGHGVKYNMEYEKAVVIKVFFADGTPFSYENYELFSPENSKLPYQVGRTDRYGRIVFIPDRTGEWTVKVFSQDGHGIIEKIRIDSLSSSETLSVTDNYPAKALIGVGIILLFFGVFYLGVRRNKK